MIQPRARGSSSRNSALSAPNQQVAVVIPAYNEEARIGAVLRAACQARLVNEIIVVSDGSSDRTVEVAQRHRNVRVVALSKNRGKGAAMAAGVQASEAGIIAFVDADLDDLRPEHVDQIIRPLLGGHCDMCIGVFRGGKFWSDTAQRISPYISGQRALTRTLFEAVPYISEMRMGVEVSINTYARRVHARVLRVVLRGVSNTYKEKKMGLVKGLAARWEMYHDIVNAKVRMRRRKPRWRARHH